jgi:tetratricopeptide (TPR) repeat protein
VTALEQAVAIDPNGSEAAVFLAKAYLDGDEKLEEAVRLGRKALDLAPGSELAPLAHFVLADLYNRLGRPRDAAREVGLGRALENRGPHGR